MGAGTPRMHSEPKAPFAPRVVHMVVQAVHWDIFISRHMMEYVPARMRATDAQS